MEKVDGGAKSIIASERPSAEVVVFSGFALPPLKLKATWAASSENVGVAAWSDDGMLLVMPVPALVKSLLAPPALCGAALVMRYVPSGAKDPP